MTLILGIATCLIIRLYFFRESFIAELAISFVPYIIGFCIIAILTEIYLIIHESNRKRKHKGIRLFFTIIITILSIGIGTLYSSEYFGFYNQNDESIRQKDKTGIKVFYSNIYYKNTDYNSLQEKIEQENPDIVILVEFSDEHENQMKKFFKENYPYMNRNSWSTMLAGDVVFSKIPLEIITETHKVEAGARNYSYMKILSDENKDGIDLYVIHTSAPVSYKNFEMRNTQISKLLSDFLKQHKDGTPTIIIGDFNLSPRSHFYKQFTKHTNMLNALSFQSQNYTRSLHRQGIFRSHIDHIFISPEIKISPIKIENLTGSDHRSFIFNFGTD